MPQMDGFHVMAALAERNVDWPVIVMTGHGEIPIAVRAMKLGAVDFIEKPFSEQALLGCFAQAFELLEERAAAGKRRREASERAALLTARETRGAGQPARRPFQQADRQGARHQPAHGRDASRQHDGPAAAPPASPRR